MDRVLHGLHWQSLILYLNSIVIAYGFNTHMTPLENTFKNCAVEPKLKPSKCEPLQSQVRYLGHIVSKDRVATDLEKVQAAKMWPPLTTTTTTGLSRYSLILQAVYHIVTSYNNNIYYLTINTCQGSYKQHLSLLLS